EAIVQAAVARAWIKRNIGNFGRAQRVCYDVTAEAGGVDARRNRSIECRQGPAGRRTHFCAIASVARQSKGSAMCRPTGGWPASNRITRPVANTDMPPFGLERSGTYQVAMGIEIANCHRIATA